MKSTWSIILFPLQLAIFILMYLLVLLEMSRLHLVQKLKGGDKPYVP